MKNLTLAAITAGSLIVAGCNRSGETGNSSASHDGKAEEHGHGGADHSHAERSGTPHGGTPVEVGDHGFHLELVPDVVDGKMLAYVLDAHMEKEVSVSGGAFELIAKTGGDEHRLTFDPISDATKAPNATADKTSVFSAAVKNVITLTNFEGVIPKITLDGKTFENVRFSYPKGSRHEH